MKTKKLNSDTSLPDILNAYNDMLVKWEKRFLPMNRATLLKVLMAMFLNGYTDQQKGGDR